MDGGDSSASSAIEGQEIGGRKIGVGEVTAEGGGGDEELTYFGGEWMKGGWSLKKLLRQKLERFISIYSAGILQRMFCVLFSE